jgi:3-methyladenine DNA glycosylase/8-oxoguanine DNA glycosylase
VKRTFAVDPRLDLTRTLGPIYRAGGLMVSFAGGQMSRATRTPDGPATTRLRMVGADVEVEAWGPGAEWALEHAPVLVGANDDLRDFEPDHPLIRELHRRYPGLRTPRTEAVFETVLPIVLEQKVPGVQARYAYRRLVEDLGEPAPGPLNLRLPPAPETLARLPYWALHKYGVERRRADVIRRSAAGAVRLEETVRMDAEAANRRLRAFPGLGPWTAAGVAAVALGDPDAVPVGDFHIPHMVSWALAREPRGDDQRMLELLEPYRGHRGRVVRLLMLAGITAPRYGPRMPLRWI